METLTTQIRKRKGERELTPEAGDSQTFPVPDLESNDSPPPEQSARTTHTSRWSSPFGTDKVLFRITGKDGSKREILLNAFTYLSVLLILTFILLVSYLNFLMLRPYFMPMFWAMFVAIPLSIAHSKVLKTLNDFKLSILISSNRNKLLTFFTISAIGVSSYLFPPALIVFSLVGLPLVLALFLPWQSLFITISLLFFVLFSLILPLLFLIQKCALESVEVTNAILNITANNSRLIDDYNTIFSKWQELIVGYGSYVGLDPNSLSISSIENELKALTVSFFDTIFLMAKNVGSFLVSLFFFFFFLYVFLAQKDSFWNEVMELSPLPREEHEHIIENMFESVSRILGCSFVVSVSHFWITFAVLYYCDYHLAYICSALTAFLSIFPFFPTYIVWIPLCLIQFIQGHYWQAVTMTISQIVATWYLDTKIYNVFHPQNTTYIGLCVFLGISAYGFSGAILGPLLAGIMQSIVFLYKQYYRERILTGRTQ